VKTLTETVNWYCNVENRKWKRVLQCIEMSLISMLAVVISTVLYVYGDNTKLQPILMFFTLTLSILSALLVVPFYQSITFNRWHVQVIKLTFICSLGLSTLAGLVMLELQL
jgi:hypothetical protein